MNEDIARQQVITIAHRMYDRGFVVATDGNISLRLESGRILFTPGGISLCDTREDDLLLCDSSGKPLEGGRITSEAPMHLETYRLRPDVNGIIHAHPPYTVALSLAGITIDDNLLPEVIMSTGRIPTAPFATPSTPEGANAIRGLIEKHDTIILDRHGSLTVGRTLQEAFYRLERLEFSARVILIAMTVGKPESLTTEEIRKIRESAEKYVKGL